MCQLERTACCRLRGFRSGAESKPTLGVPHGTEAASCNSSDSVSYRSTLKMQGKVFILVLTGGQIGFLCAHRFRYLSMLFAHAKQLLAIEFRTVGS